MQVKLIGEFSGDAKHLHKMKYYSKVDRKVADAGRIN
jgi:hypothetical protein